MYRFEDSKIEATGEKQLLLISVFESFKKITGESMINLFLKTNSARFKFLMLKDIILKMATLCKRRSFSRFLKSKTTENYPIA